jgi:hypothetical protein
LTGAKNLKEIIIQLGAGTIVEGFNRVNIQLKSDRKTQWEDYSSLPPNPELSELLDRWQALYPTVIRMHSTDSNQSPVFDENTVTDISTQDPDDLNYRFREEMNKWLNLGDFSRIDRKLRTDLNVLDRILVIIVSEQLQIWQLPWHFWNLFADYQQVVEVFSKPKFSDVRSIKPQRNGQVNILTVSGLDPRSNLDPSLLNTLSRSQPQTLETNSADDIAAKLNQSDRAWDIFIFNGHGNPLTDSSYSDGVIYLDNDTPIEISRLKREIKKAVDRGLQIMIFNCCNGLGLAEQLSDLNIPYLIVMREIVPNQCAQDFLDRLLKLYSQGNSFPIAFKQARESLKRSSGGFAKFADWLPILFHHQSIDRVSWEDLSAGLFESFISSQFTTACRYLTHSNHRIWTNVGVSSLISILALNLQSHPQIVASEDSIVDGIQAMQAQMFTRPPSKVTLVNYDVMSLPDTVVDDRELKELMKQVESQTKPMAWSIGFKINKDNQIFDPHIVQGCTDESSDHFRLTDCNRVLINTLLAKYKLPNSFTQDFRLNLDLSTGSNSQIDRVRLSEIFNENNPKSNDELHKLFDGKIILVGNFDPRTINSLTKSAIIIDRIIRANDRQQFLPLFIYRSSPEQFAWIFLWSLLTGIVMSKQNWRKLALKTISGEIAIGGILLILGQGLPIIITPIAMILVGSTIRILIGGASLARNLGVTEFKNV